MAKVRQAGNDAGTTEPHAEVLNFLLAIARAIKAQNTYPTGHPTAELSVQLLKSALHTLLKRESPLRIVVSSERLLIARVSVESRYDFVERFRRICFERSICGLSFGSGTEDSELLSLLEVFCARPQELSFMGGARAVLVEKGVTNIELLETARSDGTQPGSPTELPRLDYAETARTLQALRQDGNATFDLGLINALKDPTTLSRLLREAYRASSHHDSSGSQAVVEFIENLVHWMSRDQLATESELTNLLTSACLSSPEIQKVVSLEKLKGGSPALRFVGDEIYHLPPESLKENLVSLLKEGGFDGGILRDFLIRSVSSETAEELSKELAKLSSDGSLPSEQVDQAIEVLQTIKPEPEKIQTISIGEAWRDLPHDREFNEYLQSRPIKTDAVYFHLELLSYETDRERKTQKLTFVLQLILENMDSGEVERVVPALAEIFLERRKIADSERLSEEVLLEALSNIDGERLVHLLLDRLAELSKAGWEVIMKLCSLLKDSLVDSLLERLVGTDDMYREETIVRGILHTGAESHESIARFFEEHYRDNFNKLLPVVIRLPRALSNRLLDGVYQEGGRMRLAMLEVLATTFVPQSARWLLRGLKDPDPRVRRLCVGALGAFREPRVVRQLTGFLDSARVFGKDFEDSIFAIQSLAKIGDSRAVPCLENILRRRSILHPRKTWILKQTALSALEKIRGQYIAK